MTPCLLRPALAILVFAAGFARADEPPDDIRGLGGRDRGPGPMTVTEGDRGDRTVHVGPLPVAFPEDGTRRNAAPVLVGLNAQEPKAAAGKELRVRPTEDFELKGDGSADAWRKADWEPLARRDAGGLAYETRVKVLYSPRGLYVLMDATDRKISSTFRDDFANLWTEDVFEVFLWPDERDPVYFEYEISPLGRELPILVPNLGGKHLGWRPWNYEGARRTRKATSAVGGALASGGEVAGWVAEVFIPYQLLSPLRNVPPSPGTRWRANFYRMDYDGGRPTGWDWARVGPSFHEITRFGTLVFEGAP